MFIVDLFAGKRSRHRQVVSLCFRGTTRKAIVKGTADRKSQAEYRTMRDNSRMGQPFFSPSSVFWRVNRELASGLAGPRAVLMQIAHPLVAAGVTEHSRFRQHRLARLYRTSVAAAAITF